VSGPSSLARSAGILLHPTSLPGQGIGDIGPGARRFADLLADMRLQWWQMLPVNPTGYGDSPYQSPSSFAGNPLLISLEDLVEDGLLAPDEVVGDFEDEFVDFEAVIPWKHDLLELATARFASRPTEEDYETFLDTHLSTWLDDFSVFTALKRAEGMRPWWEWNRAMRERQPAALRHARDSLDDSIRAIRIEQYLFDRGFRRLRAHCHERGVRLIGDIPIFVAHDSVDVWAHPELFLLDAERNPTVVAGVPPDYFSPTGQRWGNPLYDWTQHSANDFTWWTDRLRRSTDLFDQVRIDHFRGFVASWHIPSSENTAVRGEWIPAPGMELFTHLQTVFGDLPVIAEDLGVITPEVEELRDAFGLPGMKVLQFGFGTESAHSLEAFTENVVAYTGTHDNDTSRGWFESKDAGRATERQTAMARLGTDGSDFAWDLIEAVFSSVASVAVVPLQDVLSLGTKSRMNTPGVAGGNWRWRFAWEQVGDDLVARMSETVQRTDRA
jgi:4-alpha-glucanotransferase